MTPTLLKAASMLNEKPRAQTPAVGNSVHCVTEGLLPTFGNPKNSEVQGLTELGAFVPRALHFGHGELVRASVNLFRGGEEVPAPGHCLSVFLTPGNTGIVPCLSTSFPIHSLGPRQHSQIWSRFMTKISVLCEICMYLRSTSGATSSTRELCLLQSGFSTSITRALLRASLYKVQIRLSYVM
jgi:hypothetical protein